MNLQDVKNIHSMLYELWEEVLRIAHKYSNYFYFRIEDRYRENSLV